MKSHETMEALVTFLFIISLLTPSVFAQAPTLCASQGLYKCTPNITQEDFNKVKRYLTNEDHEKNTVQDRIACGLFALQCLNDDNVDIENRWKWRKEISIELVKVLEKNFNQDQPQRDQNEAWYKANTVAARSYDHFGDEQRTHKNHNKARENYREALKYIANTRDEEFWAKVFKKWENQVKKTNFFLSFFEKLSSIPFVVLVAFFFVVLPVSPTLSLDIRKTPISLSTVITFWTGLTFAESFALQVNQQSRVIRSSADLIKASSQIDFHSWLVNAEIQFFIAWFLVTMLLTLLFFHKLLKSIHEALNALKNTKLGRLQALLSCTQTVIARMCSYLVLALVLASHLLLAMASGLVLWTLFQRVQT